MTAAAASVVTLAHLSDVHLGPMPRVPLTELNAKRAAGLFNWVRKRRHVQRPDIAERMARDVVAQAPDHIIVSGDLINIGLPAEVVRARGWLEALGSGDVVSVVPGNHDIYSTVGGRKLGIEGLVPWRKHFEPCAEGQVWRGREPFPFVRVIERGNTRVAVIGCNSALETPPFVAHGRIGEAQRASLARVLEATRAAGLVRVVVLHHPPLPGVTAPHHHLLDAPALVAVLKQHGAELVLHGHNHRRMIKKIMGADGMIAVVGVPSASAARVHKSEPLARAHLYEVSATDGLRISMIARGLESVGGPVVQIERMTLLERAARA